MKTLRGQFPVVLMSRVFDVSKSGYYTWLKRTPSKRTQGNARLAVAIQVAHVHTRQTYGPDRLQDELAADGFHAGVGRIKRIRTELGIRCKQTRKFKATTNSNHALPVAANLLKQDFTTLRPHQVWVTERAACPWGTSPTFRRTKAGCTWRASRTCTRVKSSATRWEIG